jgi:Toprim domain-containing protein/DNA primase-like protein
MDVEHIIQLLHGLGCGKITVGHNGWVRSECPFARWRHASTRDVHPSFAIKIDIESSSSYRCLACHAVGDLMVLLFSVSKRTGRDLSDLFRLVQVHDQPSAEFLTRKLAHVPKTRTGDASGYWGTKQDTRTIAGIKVSAGSALFLPETLKLPTLPEEALDPIRALPPEIYCYLTGPKRNLSPASVASWELGWHAFMRRIAIPIRDCQGNLVGISGRAFDEDQQPKFLHSLGFRRDYYLYGENRIRRNQRGFLCEGFFDAIYLHQNGYNTVAMLGSYLSKFQIEKLVTFFTDVMIVPDGDVPGKEAAIRAEQVLGVRIPTTVASVPTGKDPDELDTDELLAILGPPTIELD